MTEVRQNSISFKAYVDRIENGLAVIISSDEASAQLDWPLDHLPDGLKAGDHLLITVHPDQQNRQETLQKIAKLREELRQTADSDATGFKI